MLDLALPAKIAVLLRDATQAGNEEGRLFSQAITVRRKKKKAHAQGSAQCRRRVALFTYGTP